MAYYLDTSALVKLVVAEAETTALAGWIAERTEPLVTGQLGRTELLRAVRRADPERMETARSLCSRLHLLEATATVFDEAARLDPPTLRTLDALHLATALRLGAQLLGIVTYDERLADATRTLGIPALAPA